MKHRFWYPNEGQAWCLACHAINPATDCPVSEDEWNLMVQALKNSVKDLDKNMVPC